MPGDAGPHLALDGLTRSYAGVAVVRDLTVAVPRGSLLALLGPSGCGKTTTLRMVAGLERPDSGRVMVAGRDITGLPPHRRRMGVVFQSYALFPHLSVSANVAFGLRMQGAPRADRTRRAAAALGLVGLTEHAEKRPRELSGGQQQRVALARAIAIEPDVLLFDEPLSALDAKLRAELRVEMRSLQRRLGATAVFVTHDQAEALAMADTVAVMQAGRIAQVGPPEDIFERPATPFVAEFVGRSARFRGVARNGVVEAGPARIRPGGPALPEGCAAELFIRPHRIRLLQPGEAADNVLAGTLASLDYIGETVQAVVDTAAGPVPFDLATTDDAWRGLAPGLPVRLGWRAEDTQCFRA